MSLRAVGKTDSPLVLNWPPLLQGSTSRHQAQSSSGKHCEESFWKLTYLPRLEPNDIYNNVARVSFSFVMHLPLGSLSSGVFSPKPYKKCYLGLKYLIWLDETFSEVHSVFTVLWIWIKISTLQQIYNVYFDAYNHLKIYFWVFGFFFLTSVSAGKLSSYQITTVIY